MLSGAKHLQCLFENKQMQILRFAQDDSGRGDSFGSLLVDKRGDQGPPLGLHDRFGISTHSLLKGSFRQSCHAGVTKFRCKRARR
jgi:hypothetical protein